MKNNLTNAKLIIGVMLATIFSFFDFYIGTGLVLIHLGPFIVACFLISVIQDLERKIKENENGSGHSKGTG